MDSSDNEEYHPLPFTKVVNKIKTKVVCRDYDINYILGLLGQTPMDEPAPAILIHGDTGTGKSLILKNCLELGKFRHAIVNCIEGYNMKLIYESIINQLTGHVMNEDNSYEPYAKCNNFRDFTLELQKVAENFQIGKQGEKDFSIIIVLDKTEELRKSDSNILTAFLKLRELTNLKICVVFVSILPWTNFCINSNALEPITYYLNHYTQKQVLKILELDRPVLFSEKFYENYLNLFLSIFYQACHDVRELKYQALINFESYSRPIKDGELTENDVSELWKRSQPFFKKSLKSLYLKMDNDMENVENLTPESIQCLNMELPFYSKYLLVGSYLASYNPAREDKRLFVKNHGKVRKSKIRSRKVRHNLLGPKPFSLQRLLAIVSAILTDKKFNLNADLFMEVANLVKMNLLTLMGDDVLDSPLFKCNVGFQFVDIICNNMQFPLRKYLVDYMDD